jgi:hypothetical protein
MNGDDNDVAVEIVYPSVSFISLNGYGNRFASSLVNDADICVIIRKLLDCVFNMFPVVK